MLKLAIVGLVGAVVGGLTVVGLRPRTGTGGSRAESSSVEEVARARRTPGPSERSADPTDLTQCRQALFRRELELRGAQASAARAVAGPRSASRDETPAASDAMPQAEPEVDSETQAAERRRYREAATKVRDAVVEHFGISNEEERTLADLMCPQRDNERSLLSEFAAGRMDAQTLFARIAEERATSTEGMRRSLGSGRFRRLQRVGVLGMLGSKLCKGR